MSKYHAVRTVVNGERFDSKRELARYRELQLLQKTGEIHGLQRQVCYHLHVKPPVGPLIIVARFIVDFRYWDTHGQVLEDSKGFRTPIYRLKKKMLKAEYNLEVLET